MSRPRSSETFILFATGRASVAYGDKLKLVTSIRPTNNGENWLGGSRDIMAIRKSILPNYGQLYLLYLFIVWELNIIAFAEIFKLRIS